MTTALRDTGVGAQRDRIVEEVRALYEATFPAEESGKFTPHDWKRCEAALAQVSGPDVLDVGVGAGQTYNVLARDPAIDRLVGLDIRWNKKLIRPERGELQLGSIFALPFPDGSFDTVLCMEVLEHLEAIEFPKALHEVRRVCRGTLVMTVPYEEPEPLWHHDVPGGHRQQFSEEKIERWFPRAERQLIPRRKGACPWIMLVERPR
ncbi:MAG TPA: class I SAM-dependent methyltransferase [Kofleriaceae bacterium]|nr:class I SAM-dependent methyltransferase [Kofleriaceae bacterium]